MSWLEDTWSPPQASESQTPPLPFVPAAPPRLLAPSSPPSPVGPPAPPGSFVPPAPPWSVVDPPLPQDSAAPAALCRSVPPVLLGSSLRRLHCGPPSGLWPWSHLAPPAPSPYCLRHGSSFHLICPGFYCFIPDSFLHLLHPGLCGSSSSQVSVLCQSLYLSCLPANLSLSPFSIPHPLLCPPPKSPSIPPFVVPLLPGGGTFCCVFIPHVLCVTYFSLMFDWCSGVSSHYPHLCSPK